MDSNISLSDIAAVTGNDGFGGNNSWLLILLFAMIYGNGGFFGGNRGDYGNFATAASQQDILFGQKFSDLDNKMDRLGNGIADATFSLNGSITNEGRALQQQISNCCCENQKNVDSVRFDMSNYAAQLNANIDAKFAALEKNQLEQRLAEQAAQINKLQMDQALCGVVRYPNQFTYSAPTNPFCGCTGLSTI